MKFLMAIIKFWKGHLLREFSSFPLPLCNIEGQILLSSLLVKTVIVHIVLGYFVLFLGILFFVAFFFCQNTQNLALSVDYLNVLKVIANELSKSGFSQKSYLCCIFLIL